MVIKHPLHTKPPDFSLNFKLLLVEIMAAATLHIVMFPWSAFGHMIPFYQLSVGLAKKGVRVSYVTTPRNIERLPKISPNLAPLLQYVSLEMPTTVTGLPKGAEATVDVEYDEVQYLKAAYDLLSEPFKQLISTDLPDWIVSDFASHWMPDIAQEYQIPLMYFSIFTASFILFTGPPEYVAGEGQKRLRATPDTMTIRPEWAEIFPPSMALTEYEASVVHPGIYDNNASGVTDAERFARMVQGSKAVCVRSCHEFEGDYIERFQTLIHKPVVPVGLLPPTKEDREKDSVKTGGQWTESFKWLDQQGSRSVIHVGFGSEYKLTKNEVYEIAYGLELSQLPFIWTLRRPTWAKDDSEVLPPGFENRTLGKGIVCMGWAPQLTIFAHPSVGASLYHCGIASTVELLQHGHTLILLPCIVDQGINARLLESKGLGIEVKRREDGSYSRDDIADALRRAMVGDEAQRIRDQARQAAALFGDQKLQEDHYIGGLVDYLRNGVGL